MQVELSDPAGIQAAQLGVRGTLPAGFPVRRPVAEWNLVLPEEEVERSWEEVT